MLFAAQILKPGTKAPAVEAFADDINNKGQVVGRYSLQGRAFLWQNGVSDLGPGEGSWARAINNSGVLPVRASHFYPQSRRRS